MPLSQMELTEEQLEVMSESAREASVFLKILAH
jgi:hypothetical protein